MARIIIPSDKTNSTITETSSNVSSSVSGNIGLIQSQIQQKTNDYINIRNAVKILENFNNWNGYIKLFTEVESNFEVNDIVYVTYTSPNRIQNTTFSLDNNYNNYEELYYDDPYDEHVKDWSFGYKVLYVNKYNNEVVINRHYNDIYNFTFDDIKYSTISTTTLNIVSSDIVTLTGGTNLYFTSGQQIVIEYDYNNYMIASIITYNLVNGEIVANVESFSGSGIYNLWKISMIKTDKYILNDQFLSKVSCRGGNFFGDISDGVVFYSNDKNLNFFNGEFGIIKGTISGATGAIPNSIVLCSGLFTTGETNGYYSLNAPAGNNIVKFWSPGYITSTINTNIIAKNTTILNIFLTSGYNSVNITSFGIDSTCSGGTINFQCNTVGYSDPMTYQWKIFRDGYYINVGLNSSVLAYNSFKDEDKVSCTVSDEFENMTSNIIEINIIPQSITILDIYPGTIISQGDFISFTGTTSCYTLPTSVRWLVEGYVVGYGFTFSTSATSNFPWTIGNNDIVFDIIGGISVTTSITVIASTTTTTTTII